MNTIAYIGTETKCVSDAFVNTSVWLFNTCSNLLAVVISGEWEKGGFHMFLAHFDLTECSIIYNSFLLLFLWLIMEFFRGWLSG